MRVMFFVLASLAAMTSASAQCLRCEVWEQQLKQGYLDLQMRDLGQPPEPWWVEQKRQDEARPSEPIVIDRRYTLEEAKAMLDCLNGRRSACP